MAYNAVAFRPAPLWEIKATARRLAYLGTTDKIMVALANEYGADRPMPARAWLQSLIDERKASFAKPRRQFA